ncbi:MAG: glycoside hydrolase family 1 protein [Actinobacteria bacterium]|nr:glycoside hydrolase family 1 protein [Actinomycetota bacterium]
MTLLNFPDGFIWGTASSAHQVEGGNWNNDWWLWEHIPGGVFAGGGADPSGDACDHLFRYPEDIALLADLGFNAYRFSIEWARIEPEEGLFSTQWLDHYRRMIATCRDHGLTPIVTFHHFTSPRWVHADGSWENPAVVDRFARYCERVVAHLGDVMGVVCTINEPNVVALYGYRLGMFPPGLESTAARAAATEHFIAAHRKAVDIVKAGPGNSPVGLALSMTDFQALEGGEERMARYRYKMEDVFLEACRGDDFIGVQTYTRDRIDPEGRVAPEDGVPLTLMGYEFWPQSLEATVRRAWEVTDQTPVVVTESGIGTDDDASRVDYVTQALQGVHRCLDDGIDVRGYCYWSNLDNFEWLFGYKPTFGLVAVERETQVRSAKPSAAWLGGIAKANALTV